MQNITKYNSPSLDPILHQSRSAHIHRTYLTLPLHEKHIVNPHISVLNTKQLSFVYSSVTLWQSQRLTQLMTSSKQNEVARHDGAN